MAEPVGDRPEGPRPRQHPPRASPDSTQLAYQLIGRDLGASRCAGWKLSLPFEPVVLVGAKSGELPPGQGGRSHCAATPIGRGLVSGSAPDMKCEPRGMPHCQSAGSVSLISVSPSRWNGLSFRGSRTCFHLLRWMIPDRRAEASSTKSALRCSLAGWATVHCGSPGIPTSLSIMRTPEQPRRTGRAHPLRGASTSSRWRLTTLLEIVLSCFDLLVRELQSDLTSSGTLCRGWLYLPEGVTWPGPARSLGRPCWWC
jgi:hypothetical protein